MRAVNSGSQTKAGAPLCGHSTAEGTLRAKHLSTGDKGEAHKARNTWCAATQTREP